jgi:hypothetical protein
MPPIDTSVFGDDLDAVIADLAAHASHQGVLFDCAVSELSSDQQLMLAGNMEDKLLECVFPVAAVPAAPTVSARIAITISPFTSKNYMVKTVRTSQDGIAFHLIVQDDNRVGWTPPTPGP